MAYVTEKRGVFYAVIYQGRNPVSGRDRRRWHRCDDRAGAEQLANDLTEQRARQRHTGSSLTVAEYILGQWLPAKEATLAPTTHARYVTSVCTGSLLLGAAGLLTGYKATSHWATVSLLPVFGATPAEGRIVRDRNRITAGGVTAGIDFGLSLVGRLRDRQYAECVQLMAQYAPEPPYDAGTPEKAPGEVTKMMTNMFVDFNKQAEKIGRDVYPRYRDG